MKQSVIIKTAGIDSNGITCPLSVLEQIRDQINSRDNNFGELSPKDNVNEINHHNLSHKYSDAHIENNQLTVTIETLDTPSGHILNKCLQSLNKTRYAFTSRSIGVISNDNVVYDENIKLISVDFKLLQ